MEVEKLTAYLSNLLNRDIGTDDAFSLSSAQRARLFAWMSTNGFAVTSDAMAGVVTVRQLTNVPAQIAQHQQPKIHQSSDRQHLKELPMVSMGIDLQSVSELFPDGLPSDPKDSPELKKIFTLKELSYAQAHKSPLEALTGIFSAKEAVLKTGDTRPFNEIEILPDVNGVPRTLGFSVSISHSGGFAVAVAQSSGPPSSPIAPGSFSSNLEIAAPAGFVAVTPQGTKYRKVLDSLVITALIILLVLEFSRAY